VKFNSGCKNIILRVLRLKKKLHKYLSN